MTINDMRQLELILPAPDTATETTYCHLSLGASTGTVSAFSATDQLGTAEVTLPDTGAFRVRFTRGSDSVVVDLHVTHDKSRLSGTIDGEPFSIEEYGANSGPTITEAQSQVMAAWPSMGRPLVSLGKAVDQYSELQADHGGFALPSLGCIATAAGVGVAAFACVEGAIAACAAGLYGVGYLADHCI
ncbi:MAG TPA: hypothetical protein VFR99_06775 [Marmoricola sp.]|nr:hypothetical protein [Marmoricola sp.]